MIRRGLLASEPRHRRGDSSARTALRCALPARSARSAVRSAGAWRRGWASGPGGPPRPRDSTGQCCSGRVSRGGAPRPPTRGSSKRARWALRVRPPGQPVAPRCGLSSLCFTPFLSPAFLSFFLTAFFFLLLCLSFLFFLTFGDLLSLSLLTRVLRGSTPRAGLLSGDSHKGADWGARRMGKSPGALGGAQRSAGRAYPTVAGGRGESKLLENERPFFCMCHLRRKRFARKHNSGRFLGWELDAKFSPICLFVCLK